MLNSISIMGRLTRDPELKHTPQGVPVCTVTLACERDYAGPDGRREADFIDVVCWRQTAEFVSRWFRKGLLVAVEGRLQSRRWADSYGQNRTSHEVVADSVYFAEKTERGNPSQPPAAAAPPTGGAKAGALLPESDYAGFDDEYGEEPF